LKRRDGTTFLDINDAKIYQSPGFREIWEFDQHPA
jgi:hypothetical protein